MVPAAREIHKQLHFDILTKVSRHTIFAEFHLMHLDVYMNFVNILKHCLSVVTAIYFFVIIRTDIS